MLGHKLLTVKLNASIMYLRLLSKRREFIKALRDMTAWYDNIVHIYIPFDLNSFQTNVYETAQNTKMEPFEKFKRKAVIVVPTHDNLRRRTSDAKRKTDTVIDIPFADLCDMKCTLFLYVKVFINWNVYLLLLMCALQGCILYFSLFFHTPAQSNFSVPQLSYR